VHSPSAQDLACIGICRGYFVLNFSFPLRTARCIHTTKHAGIERALLLLLDLLLLLLLLAIRLAAMFWHWGLQVFVSS